MNKQTKYQTDNARQGCGAIRTLLNCCWRKYKLTQPFWRLLGIKLLKVSICTIQVLAISLLSIYPAEMHRYIFKDMYKYIYISIICKRQQLERSKLSFKSGMYKTTIIHYTAMRINVLLLNAILWMIPTNTMQREISHSQVDAYCVRFQFYKLKISNTYVCIRS